MWSLGLDAKGRHAWPCARGATVQLLFALWMLVVSIPCPMATFNSIAPVFQPSDPFE